MLEVIAEVLEKNILSRVRTDDFSVRQASGAGFPARRPITRDDVIHHLNGGPRGGAYFIRPGESVVMMAAIDMDSHKGESTWDEMVIAAVTIRDILQLSGIDPIPVRSSGGNGIHLIMLWDEPQDAYSVRETITEALGAVGFRNGAKGVHVGEVEVFPKQDTVIAGRYGNMIWLPFANKSEPLDLDLGITTGLDSVADMAWPLSVPVAVRERPAVVQRDAVIGAQYDRLRQMLDAVDPNTMGYDEWFNIGLAIHYETEGSPEGLTLWIDWSSRSDVHDDSLMEYKWESMGQGSSGVMITGGTLIKAAREAGWVEVVSDDEFAPAPEPEVITVVDGETGEVTEVTVPAADLPRFDPWRNANGKYQNRIDPELNALMLAVRTPEMVGGNIRFDTFTQELLLINGDTFDAVDDNTLVGIRARLESGEFAGARFAPIPATTFREAVESVAAGENRVDTAAAWADSLVWDGVPRIGTFYRDYMHVDGADVDSGYAEALGNYMWTALAGRALVPGIKADTSPIWVDPTGGMRKSSLIKALLPFESWYVDIHLGKLFNNRDDLVRSLKGALIGEVAELRGLHTASAEDIKGFMTETIDSVHVMYKNTRAKIPRRTLFIGTTNEVDFIVGMKGDRRLGPIMVGVGDREIDIDGIVVVREQLWAEGTAMFKANGIMWQALEPLLGAVHENFLENDDWIHTIIDHLDGMTEEIMDETGEVFRRGDRPFTTAHLAEKALIIPVNRQDLKSRKRIANILKGLGYRQRKAKVKGSQKTQWEWSKIA